MSAATTPSSTPRGTAATRPSPVSSAATSAGVTPWGRHPLIFNFHGSPERSRGGTVTLSDHPFGLPPLGRSTRQIAVTIACFKSFLAASPEGEPPLRCPSPTPSDSMQCLSARVGPGAGDQSAVPAQQGVWLDDEAGPAGSEQRAADRGEQGAVGGLELGTWRVAAEHGELVAQDKDLQVLGGVAAGQQREQANRSAQRQVHSFDSPERPPQRLASTSGQILTTPSQVRSSPTLAMIVS